LTICVVLTARASLARVRTVLENLSGNSGVDLRVILAGGALLHHYGDTERDLPVQCGHRVYTALAGNTLETTAAETGLLAMRLSAIFAEDQPDLVVVVADRHETLAISLAAAYQHIPLAHIQGGEHTGSIDDKVRHANSMLADYHFPATHEAATTLRQMGVRGDIYMLGCPSIDLAAKAEFDPKWERHLVVLQHPVTDEAASAAAQIDETFAAITAPEFNDRPVLWLWPGQDAGSDLLAKRLREHREHDDVGGITFQRHLPAQQFLSVLRSADCLVGNSSAGVRESSFLGCPVVNVGTRQRGRERAGNVIDVTHDRYAIRSAIARQCEHGRYQGSTLYGEGRSGEAIARYLIALCRHPAPQGQQGVSGEVYTPVSGFDAT
jgi:UDP-hydrolysing UDP-N-acetyl-D-glucosamine 2-epimerase